MATGTFQKNSTIYTVSSVLVIFASVLTFPIVTRYLTPAEYGLLNLATIVVGVLSAVGKMGLPRSVLRYYTSSTAAEGGLKMFTSTSIIGMTATSSLVTAVFICVFLLLQQWLWPDEEALFTLLWIAVGLSAMTKAIGSGMVNLLKGAERALQQSFLSITQTYLVLLLIFIIIVNVQQTAFAMISLVMVVEIFIILLGLALFFRKSLPNIRYYNPQLNREMIRFGAPFVGLEVSAILMSSADKFVIGYFHGLEMVAQYSVPYNLCNYIYLGLFVSVTSAANPIATRYFETKGKAAAEEFLGMTTDAYFWLAIPCVVGFALFANDLIMLLTNGNYTTEPMVVGLLIGSFCLRGYSLLAEMSLYLAKKSSLMLYIMLGITAISVLLNFVLVPTFGVLGAAVVTVIAQCVNLGVVFYLGRGHLKQRIPWHTLATSSASCVPMLFLADAIKVTNPVATLALQVTLCGAAYLLVLYAIDGRVREFANSNLSSLRNRLGTR